MIGLIYVNNLEASRKYEKKKSSWNKYINYLVLGKNPPGKKPPDPKSTTIPNLTLTLPLTPHGGLFWGGYFHDTKLFIAYLNEMIKGFVFLSGNGFS